MIRAKSHPHDLLEQAVDQGFWAALVPEELDGCGLDTYTYMLMLEELARADMSTALILSVHNSLVVKPLLDSRHGRAEGPLLGSAGFWRQCWAPLP